MSLARESDRPCCKANIARDAVKTHRSHHAQAPARRGKARAGQCACGTPPAEKSVRMARKAGRKGEPCDATE